MQGDQGHAPGGVAGKAVGRHIGTDIAAVINVGCFPERGISPARIMVVATKNDWTDLATTHHVVKLQGNGRASCRIGVKNPCLAAHHQPIGLSLLDPDIVVAVFRPSRGIDAAHRRLIGFIKVFRPAAQTDPAKGSVAIVKDRPHDILKIGREDKTILGIDPVFHRLGHAGIKDGF